MPSSKTSNKLIKIDLILILFLLLKLKIKSILLLKLLIPLEIIFKQIKTKINNY